MATSVTTIDYSRCTACLRCYDLCPMDVFTVDEKTNLPKVTYAEECWTCGVCWMECPKRAIEFTLPASMW